MAANRYGRIYHSDHHFINLRFPSADARRKYAEQFSAYHAGHDHDGEVPRFEDTAASTIGNMEANRVHDAHSVSIDGYATYEIESYHNPDRFNGYDRGRYRPPTCCVAPLISINRTFIDASELTRHELSAIFMDMPEEDFENLLKSVEAEGFKDPIIRMIDEQVLDGWHRYRAAKELNLLRKLRFQQWNEKDEGDPEAFVMARNLERRHLTPGQRGQIITHFNERFGHGGDRSKMPNGTLKTREQLAKEANVSVRTIARSEQVEKVGRAYEVISGEKTQGEVITEETIKTLWEQINPAISAWKKDREGVGSASKSMFIKATLRWEGLPSDTKTSVKVLKELLKLLTAKETNILEKLIRKQLDAKDLWGDASVASETKLISELQAELKRRQNLGPGFYLPLSMIDLLDAWRSLFGDAERIGVDPEAANTEELGGTLENMKSEYPRFLLKLGQIKNAKKQKTEAEESHHDDEEGEATEQQETEHPSQTAEERSEVSHHDDRDRTTSREANKLLKKKKQLIKWMWDKRKQAAKDSMATEDNDLTTYTDLDALEKRFAQHEEHAYCADAFQSGMRRTAEQTFNICLEKTLASDVSLETLEAEYNAVSTYALDILHWQRQEWIQELIAANKAKADAKSEAKDDMDALWEAFNKRLPKWKAKYAESGYKENDLIQGATEAELFDALRAYRESERTGPITAEEIQDVTELMKRQAYPFARRLRDVLREKQVEAEAENLEFDDSLDGLNLPAMKSFFDSLMYHVGRVEDPIRRDNFSVAVFDALMADTGSLTEREQLSILLDCAQSIVSEYI